MTCPLCEVAARCRSGREPLAIGELAESFAVLSENQGCQGWCVLVLKEHAEHLDALPLDRQARLFEDVARIARAIRRVFPAGGADGGPPRINYECLGNLVAHIHWHVIPRHAGDPEPTKPVWGRAPEQLRGSLSRAELASLAGRLREALG